MSAGRNVPPRDAIGATHLWVPVDATGEDFYDLGARFGSPAGVLHALQDQTGHAYTKPEGAGFFDPHALRWHDLQRQTRDGLLDQRLSIQVVNDYEAEYEDARPGDAPFGQPEPFLSTNRTTREVDTRGRVALPSSHRRIIDSEDDRFALATTCRSVPLGAAKALDVPVAVTDAAQAGLPPGVAFHDPGTRSGTHGSVTQTQPSVSIGGLTFFGGAAVQAAQEALAAGGSAGDAARWASAAARGLPRPPLQDADPGAAGVGSTRERPPEPPEPDRNEEGNVPLLDHPAGYVWSRAGRVGLLGTLVCPEGAHGHYWTGREGTPIGPLPLRHDAQVTMGEDLVGRVVFVADDAAELPEGQGRRFKGELWADTSRANRDTELGHETLQWRPVVAVDANLPPSKPPPPDPPPWIDPPREEDDDEEEDTDPPPPGAPPPGRRGPRSQPPPRGRGPGESSGQPPPPTGVGVIPGPPFRRVLPGGEGGELPPVEHPFSQLRDYEGPGEPCPNLTAGLFLPGGLLVSGDVPIDPFSGIRPQRVPGGWIQYSPGHPAISPAPGGVDVGGFEGPLPLGLPPPRRGGIEVEPGPDRGVPRGRGVPGDDPGQIPLGLPPPQGPGLGFEPPPGGDRGVPRGWAERQEQREREERARRARNARDRAEQKQIDELEDLEHRAREAGKPNYADRVKRAREKVERRRQKREERRRRREEFEEKQRQDREERRRRREERRREREEERLEQRARRNRRREEERERRRRGRRPGPVQGGYRIPVVNAVGDTGGFGEWNTLNRPLPFFGGPGGPPSLEDWTHLATWAIRGLQRTTCGAFGGPGWLAANLGVVQRNGPGCPPAGSRIGAHWTVPPDERELTLCTGESPVEVVSVLEAPSGKRLRACSGGVLRVVREHRGDGLVEDYRPLLLLENSRSHQPSTGRADLISDMDRRFFVERDGALTAQSLRSHVRPGDRTPPLEVGRVDPLSSRLVELYLEVDSEGTTTVAALQTSGRVLLRAGAPLVLAPGGEGQGRCTVRSEPETGALEVVWDGGGERGARMVLGPKGLLVEGDLVVTGKVTHS